ncbi:MAG: GAF domain-containing sensor histidine kinase [Anaerolineales bacterium]|nr:GAF domain-containing sensor histidine kinase [Anaerolineales bacterium]
MEPIDADKEILPFAPTYARLAALYEATRTLHASLDLAEMLNRVMEAAVRLVGAERGFIMLHERWREPRVGAVHNLNPGIVTKKEELSFVLARQVQETGQSILKPDPSDDSPAPRTIMIAPLRAQDEIFGTVYVDRDLHGGQFTADDLALFEAFTDQAVIVFYNAKTQKQIMYQFMASISSELRTPLTAVKGYADLLQLGKIGPINDEQTRCLNIISQSVYRTLLLLSDIIDLTRIEVRPYLELASIDLATYLEEVLTNFRPRIEAKGQIVTLSLLNLPPVRADNWSLTKILTKLIDNAYKYTPAQGTIVVSAEVRNSFVYIALSDTGIGINSEDQPYIFEKFYRARNKIVQEQEGDGIGLYIAKRLVEYLGGEIGLESEEGKGSTFWFTLPIATTDQRG